VALIFGDKRDDETLSSNVEPFASFVARVKKAGNYTVRDCVVSKQDMTFDEPSNKVWAIGRMFSIPPLASSPSEKLGQYELGAGIIASFPVEPKTVRFNNTHDL